MRMVEVSEQANRSGALRPVLLIVGVVAMGMGIFGIGFGSFWAPAALEFFAGNEIAENFELVIPFVPIFLIALGAYLLVGYPQ